MKNISLLTLGLLALLSAANPAQAFNFSNINTDDLKNALSIGKKAIDANRDIPESEEITIGNGIAANILGASPLVNDPGLQKYVNRVGFWVAMQTDRANLPWKFGVIQSNDINAFSCPGGTILITYGLFRKLRTEAELAGVLGHEISHVLRRHQLKAIQHEMGNEWKTELAQDAANKEGGSVAAAAAKATSAGTELFSRGLDKDDEFEADRMGVVLAARAGYNPFGLVGVLQTLDEVNPKDGSVALMFKTHPAPAKRLDLLNAAMSDHLDAYAQQLNDTPRFDALKARMPATTAAKP
jgi:predicted Zn-dependent protease